MKTAPATESHPRRASKSRDAAISDAQSIDRFVYAKTRGKPFAFVIMDFKSRDSVFTKLKRAVQARGRLRCVRADELANASQDLLFKVHRLIERSEVVIADLSTSSPNVYYEVGYAMALGKDVLFLRDRTAPEPTPIDLRGKELIEYDPAPPGIERLCLRLRRALDALVDSEVALLRDMLEAPDPKPVFIVASPKQPQRTPQRSTGKVFDHRTYGDNLGVLGLVTAFGVLRGESSGVELISARYGPPKLREMDVSLYLIGSAKVNPTTDAMLRAVQGKARVRWELAPVAGRARGEEPTMQLSLVRGRQEREGFAAKRAPGKPGSPPVVIEDWGLIVRSPHPAHPDRFVVILAGAHSLGTGAACMAVTRSPLLRELKQSLLRSGIHLADKAKPFWALVKGVPSPRDGLLDPEGVRVLATGIWDTTSFDPRRMRRIRGGRKN